MFQSTLIPYALAGRGNHIMSGIVANAGRFQLWLATDAWGMYPDLGQSMLPDHI